MRAISFLLFIFCSTVSIAQMNETEWSSFISKQDLHWQNKLPKAWDEGPILGNGMMGSYIIYDAKNNAIRFEVCRADVQDHRIKTSTCRNPFYMVPRLIIGHFNLQLKGKPISSNMRLSLWDAQATGSIITDKGEISFKAYTHADKMALIIETAAKGEELEARFVWNAADPSSPRQLVALQTGDNWRLCKEYIPNPPAIIDTANPSEGSCLQPLLEDGQTATTWRLFKAQQQQQLVINCTHTYPVNNALQLSKQVLKNILTTPLHQLFATHQNWWHRYYTKSFISIPDKKIESFYWIQLYKLASITRADRALIDCPSMWVVPTAWPMAWWNLNVQLTYWPVNTSNHTDLNGSLTNSVFNHLQNLINNVPEQYRHDAAGIGRATSYDLKSPVGIPNSPDPRKGPEIGLLTWTCHNIWLHYRYSMDASILPNLYTTLRRSVNYYLHFTYQDSLGKYHLPATYSPEYGSALDCNFDLSILKWGCETLIELNSLLQKQDTLLPKWKAVAQNLTPYPQDENGLRIGKDQAYDMSHRHFSHLLMVYPFYLLNIEQPGAYELIKKSKDYWQSKPAALAGYSHTGASSIESALGNGNQALIHLQNFLTNIIRPNTLYKENNVHPVIETPLSGAQALTDMLIQSWGNKIRVFPAAPDAWKDISYDKLLTEGAFEVSAKRVNGQTTYIKVKSLAGGTCTLLPNMQQWHSDKAAQIKKLSNGALQLLLKKGESLELFAAQPVNKEQASKIIPIDGNWGSYFGLK